MTPFSKLIRFSNYSRLDQPTLIVAQPPSQQNVLNPLPYNFQMMSSPFGAPASSNTNTAPSSSSSAPAATSNNPSQQQHQYQLAQFAAQNPNMVMMMMMMNGGAGNAINPVQYPPNPAGLINHHPAHHHPPHHHPSFVPAHMMMPQPSAPNKHFQHHQQMVNMSHSPPIQQPNNTLNNGLSFKTHNGNNNYYYPRKKSCYNCGSMNHVAVDCREPTIDTVMHQLNPFRLNFRPSPGSANESENGSVAGDEPQQTTESSKVSVSSSTAGARPILKSSNSQTSLNNGTSSGALPASTATNTAALPVSNNNSTATGVNKSAGAS